MTGIRPGIKQHSVYPVRLPMSKGRLLKLRAYENEVVAVGVCEVKDEEDAVTQLNAHLILDCPFIWAERLKQNAAGQTTGAIPILSKMKSLEPA